MRQTERRANTLASLVRAARPLIAEHGLAGTSLDAIAAGAGLSKGAVYAHLAGKSDLYVLVAASILDDAAARLLNAERAIRAGEDIHSAAAAASGRPDDAEHAALIADLWQVAALDPSIRDALEEHRHDRRNRLAQAFVDAGLPPRDALRSAGTVSALIDAHILDLRLGIHEAAG